MSIVQKIILAFLCLALTPTLTVSLLIYLSFNNTLRDQSLAQLNYIATIQQHRTEDSSNRNFARIDSLRNLSTLRSSLESYNNTKSSDERKNIIQTISEIKSSDGNIKDISIAAPSGVVIGSTQKAQQYKSIAKEAYFKAGKKSRDIASFFHYANMDTVRLFLVGPISIGGELEGVAVIEVDTDDLFPHLFDYEGLGETGETLLVRKDTSGDVQVLASSRLGSATAIAKQIKTSGETLSSQALISTKETFLATNDHRGKPVLGVSRQVGKTDWRIIAKIDKTEIYKPISELRDTLLLLIFVVLVICVFLALFVARAFTEPIIVLSRAANQMSKGDLKQRVNVRSEDEIGVLAAAFNLMAESFEHLDKTKSEFILLASHQLRTPLTAVKWFSNELLHPIKTMNKKKQKHYLEQIHDSNDRMIHLVNELLIASKIDLGTLPPKLDEVAFDEVLDKVIEDLSGLIGTTGVGVQKNVSDNIPKVSMDPGWAHIIFQNLISNAIKYSRPGQEISVAIQKTQSEILLTVADQGHGIPPEQQDKIFTKLFRADNARKLVNDGSGLGLFISKALVENSGGTISFESILGQGTTFYVKIPL